VRLPIAFAGEREPVVGDDRCGLAKEVDGCIGWLCNPSVQYR